MRLYGPEDAEPVRRLCNPSGDGRLHRDGGFVYPRDRHGREYGWGWSLLTTPETLFGPEACRPDRSPQESRERILAQLRKILPETAGTRLVALLR